MWRIKQNSFWNAGVLATKELVLQGTGEGDFKIYDEENGNQLWDFPLHTGIVAPPVTYMVDGIQHISMVAGWGGGMVVWAHTHQINPGAIFTFAIGGSKNAPQFPEKEPGEFVNIEFTSSLEQINHGSLLFERYGAKCRGGNGAIPNLTFPRPEIFEAIHQIVKEGAFPGKGMPDFKNRLPDPDVLDLKNYILS